MAQQTRRENKRKAEVHHRVQCALTARPILQRQLTFLIGYKGMKMGEQRVRKIAPGIVSHGCQFESFGIKSLRLG